MTKRVEQIEHMRYLVVDRVLPYSRVVQMMGEKFPGTKWTRSAISGQVARKGWTKDGLLPPNRNRAGRKPSGKAKRPKPKRMMRDPQPAILRAESDPASGAVIKRSRRSTPEEIAQRRLGMDTSVVEETTATSRPLLDSTRNDCKFPTSNDARDLQVCGAPATIGAYCAHHAGLAYRVMPTEKRNASFHTVVSIGLGICKIDMGDDDAQWIADHVLDDVVEVVS